MTNRLPNNSTSEEVEEILSMRPSWLVTWGSTIIFVITLLLFNFTWLIKLPIRVDGSIAITTLNPPYNVVAKADGKILFLYVKNGDRVKSKSILGVLDNPGDLAEIMTLENTLRAVQYDISHIASINLPQSFQLGELQEESQIFISSLNNYRLYLRNSPTDKEIISIQNQLNNNKDFYNQLLTQKDIVEKKLRIVKSDYDRESKLFAENVISKRTLEEKEFIVLSTTNEFQGTLLSLAQSEMKIKEIEREMVNKLLQKEKEIQDMQFAIKESMKTLLNQIVAWKQKYVLMSETDGIVSFFRYWSPGQYVSYGTEVMTIVPFDKRQFVGKMLITIVNSGRVKIGQRVDIFLDNFPYDEYGKIVGYVENISLVSRDNKYAVDVKLPNELVTSYGHRLSFGLELQGQGQIITDDVSILQRIFNRTRRILKN